MKRLSYKDFSKTDYKSILTLILIIAFAFVAGRYLYKHIRQDIKDFRIKNNVKQEQLKEEPKIIQETEEPNAKAEKVCTETDITAYKKQFFNKISTNYKNMLNDMEQNKSNYYESDEITSNIPVTIKIYKDGSVDKSILDSVIYMPLAIKEAVLHTIYNDYEERTYFSPLPKNYNSNVLVLKLIFNKNGVYYRD